MRGPTTETVVSASAGDVAAVLREVDEYEMWHPLFSLRSWCRRRGRGADIRLEVLAAGDCDEVLRVEVRGAAGVVSWSDVFVIRPLGAFHARVTHRSAVRRSLAGWLFQLRPSDLRWVHRALDFALMSRAAWYPPQGPYRRVGATMSAHRPDAGLELAARRSMTAGG